MIPGQEGAYGRTDYTTITTPDDYPSQNKSMSALVPYIEMALLGANDDVRAVRLGEQAINYYMTQVMAQEEKSRWTGLDGHGTQYGTGRTATGALAIAWMLKNSLTVTPPGVVTGTYLKSIMEAYQYVFWLANPLVVQPWATGYGIDINQSGVMSLSYIGPPMMIAANLFPEDRFAAHSWDYLRRRRGDYGNLSESAGWGSIAFEMHAFPFYDPLAPAISVTEEPLQRALWKTDVDECLSAGLYCRPDTGESMAFSQSGWAPTDTQVLIQAQAALPVMNDDNYGTAGNYTILKGQYLLGGNGLGRSGKGSANSPMGGLVDGNTISMVDPTTGRDFWNGQGDRLFARMTRWAGDPTTGVADSSFAYAMIDLTPTVRDYTGANATQMSFYDSAASASRVHRHIVHFKLNGLPDYLVSYDDVNSVSGNQKRAYWHYQVTDALTNRHPEWISTYDTVGRRVTLTTPGGRLSSVFLSVGGGSIALQRNASDGTYSSTLTKGLPDAYAPPGTYRVYICASLDSVTCNNSAIGGEWIAVHRPSSNTSEVMPETIQPPCTSVAGNCAAVVIQDPVAPKVAVFARQGALISGASVTTAHSGIGQYVVTGLVPGIYDVLLSGVKIRTNITVVAADNTLSFRSQAGAIGIIRVQ
jgi:hypothetical protein